MDMFHLLLGYIFSGWRPLEYYHALVDTTQCIQWAIAVMSSEAVATTGSQCLRQTLLHVIMLVKSAGCPLTAVKEKFPHHCPAFGES
jgi:hypothetical protein